MFTDRLTLDASTRRNSDGYMAVRARVARTGVYEYAGRDVDPDNKHGLRDQATVNVLRDADAVFARASLASFVGKPITDDHPTEAVTSANWKDHARGTIMGATKDGDYVAFDLAFHDAATIAKIDGGKVELSNGYGAALAFGDFRGPNGEVCPVKQTAIVGNHIALVDKGRAGPECAIRDAATCAAVPLNDSLPRDFAQRLLDKEKPVKTMLIDGLTVDISNADTAQATIATILAARDAATGQVASLQADVATKDATIATLTADKAALEAAKPTPAQLRDAAKQFGIVVDKARAMGVTITDAMDEAAIRKAVVDAKLGATSAAYTADQYAVAFDALTNGVKIDDATTRVVPIGAPVTFGDGASVRDTIRRNRNAA